MGDNNSKQKKGTVLFVYKYLPLYMLCCWIRNKQPVGLALHTKFVVSITYQQLEEEEYTNKYKNQKKRRISRKSVKKVYNRILSDLTSIQTIAILNTQKKRRKEFYTQNRIDVDKLVSFFFPL